MKVFILLLIIAGYLYLRYAQGRREVTSGLVKTNLKSFCRPDKVG
ncbi:MAG TPA: hypothetical protein PKZ24_06200 [Nitrospirales bacterium]|nr:hypothetical protein [Nitrospirales bacterium]